MKRDIKKLMAIIMVGSLIATPISASAEKASDAGKGSNLYKKSDKSEKIEKASGVIQSVEGDVIVVNTSEVGIGGFIANKEVSIKDANGKKITVNNLKAGMSVDMSGDFLVSGLSYPAYYGGTSNIQLRDEKQATTKAVVDDEYLSFEGKVTDTDDNRIIVKSLDATRVFHLSTVIVDTKGGNIVSSNEISKGDTITAIYTSSTPMVLSDPPQINPLMIIVNNSDNYIKISRFDKKLFSIDKKLQLILGENTVIEGFKSKQIFKESDIKNRDAIVIYGATTRSMPPQTIGSGVKKVIILPDLVKNILDNESVKPDINVNKENGPNNPTSNAKNEIAKEARKMGYKINWDPKSKVVVMTKGSESIEVYVGTNRYKTNGIEKRSSVTNTIVKGTTYVGSDIISLLKK